MLQPVVRKIAIDPGFGGFKIAEIQDDQVYVDLIPSVVGIGGRIDAGLLEVWPAQRRKAIKPMSISFNGNGLSYLVGQNVHRYTRPIERLDFQRLAGGAELRALYRKLSAGYSLKSLK